MANSLSPGYVVINYTSNGHAHKQVLPVNPSTPAGPSTQLIDSSSALQLWTSFVTDWVLLLKPCFHTTDTIDTAEMWTQATSTSVPVLQDTTNIGVNGTSASAAIEWTQVTMSFRTANGSRALLKLLETPFANDTKWPAPLYSGITQFQDILSYLTGSSACVISRGGAYITSGIRAVSKTNDTLRKKFLVP